MKEEEWIREQLWDRFGKVYFCVFKFQSCRHLWWIYLVIKGFRSVDVQR